MANYIDKYGVEYTEDRKTLKRCPSDYQGEYIIPEGVTEIAAFAFSDCLYITKVVMPSTLVKFGWCGIFEGCANLVYAQFPNSVKEVPYACFKNCIKLNKVVLPDKLSNIGLSAFDGCIGLCEIKFPETLQSIESEAFRGCTSLSSLNFPRSLTGLGSRVFEGCKSLKTLELPKEVRIIGDNAFTGCTSLGIVKILGKNVDIAPSAFRGCESVSQLFLCEYNPYVALSIFADSHNLDFVVPVSPSGEPLYDEITTKNQLQASLSSELRYMAMYYHNLGMNITQMKWDESQKNDKSFKEPIDSHWRDYKLKEQDFTKLMSFDWDNSQGIGLVLGYNHYRALDVDGVNRFLLNTYDGEEGFDNFINKFLEILGLPSDYPWVVYSGSGCGFHIIFKADDIGEDIDSISFEHNDKYGTGSGNHPNGYFEQDYFERIELRWCDHLILPPSVHSCGLRYSFRNGSEPSVAPSAIGVTAIDNLINSFCGERKLEKCTYTTDKGEEFELELVEMHKIVSRHDSYLSPHDYSQMPLNWLRHSTTDDSKISLAVRYIKGDGVPVNMSEAQSLLNSCDSQDAIFNLLNLYACGALHCEAKFFCSLLKRLNSSLYPEESVNLIKENAKRVIKDSKRIVFFDTETTGLPHNYELHPRVTDNWPRLVQLSWIVTDENGELISTHNYIIKPNGFKIPLMAAAVHGITNERALKEGNDLRKVLSEFMEDVKSASLLVGHNIDFDKKVIGAELYRNDQANEELYEYIDRKRFICTMKSTIDFCQIPNRVGYGYKYPKLQELHHKLFAKYFEDAHNALSDIMATKNCFFELKKRGIIRIAITQ